MEQGASSEEERQSAMMDAAVDAAKRRAGMVFLAKIERFIAGDDAPGLFDPAARITEAALGLRVALNETQMSFVYAFNRSVDAGLSPEECAGAAAKAIYIDEIRRGSRQMDEHHHRGQRDPIKQRRHRERTLSASRMACSDNCSAGAWSMLNDAAASPRLASRGGLDEGPLI